MAEHLIDSMYLIHNKKSFTSKQHLHLFPELVYFINGSGTVHVNNTSYPFKPNTFCYYNAENYHFETHHEDTSMLYIRFKSPMEDIKLKEGAFQDVDGKLLSCFQKLLVTVRESNHKYHNRLTNIQLEELLLIAAIKQDLSIAVSPSPDNTRIYWGEIIEYIDMNLHNPISLAELAEKNNYSYDRFRHLFKQQFGVSPYAYLTNKRIEYAKFLLSHSPLSLSTIAYDCGFNSQSQFSNLFKKHTGMSPKDFIAKERTSTL